jgi:hypothetical protein
MELANQASCYLPYQTRIRTELSRARSEFSNSSLLGLVICVGFDGINWSPRTSLLLLTFNQGPNFAMALTPGLQMLLRNLPKLMIPPLLVYVLSHFLVDLSPVGTVLACILSIPCCQLILSTWHSWTLRREMACLGAQEMPKWEGKWPGSIDLLIELYGHWMVRSIIHQNESRRLNIRLFIRMAIHVMALTMPLTHSDSLLKPSSLDLTRYV